MKRVTTTCRFLTTILLLIGLPVHSSLAQIVDPQNVLVQSVFIVSADRKDLELSPIFNVSLNYRYIENDQGGFSGESSGFVTRVLLILE